MDFEEVFRQLKDSGTAQNIRIYGRHGADTSRLFGVSFGNLNKLKKKIKKDHELAIQLWGTQNIDAQTFAAMIGDPAQMDEATIDRWSSDIQYYMLADLFATQLVYPTAYRMKKLEEWTASNEEFLNRQGYVLLTELAKQSPDTLASLFMDYLKKIEREVKSAPNRTREMMNYALLAIGKRSETLNKASIAVLEKTGPVEVDHGETSCKTPDTAAILKEFATKKEYVAPGL